jgi:carboxylesterase type B
LRLPYATYRASHYDAIDDIYFFSNIRYAAAPSGSNRFGPPQRPKKATKVQEGLIGHACYQSTPTQFLLVRPAVEGLTQSEDCLFLDMFVPGHVVRSKNVKMEKLAVVHWIFGGGFGSQIVSLLMVVLGTKELYGGSIFVRESNNTLIFIRSNYRVSIFFLFDGSWVRSVGLLVLHFRKLEVFLMRDYTIKWYTSACILTLGCYAMGPEIFPVIRRRSPKVAIFYMVNNSITVMGESAGASSIMHHLTAQGGNITLPFQKASIQSPAFFPQ